MAKRPSPKPEPTVTLRDHMAALREADELRYTQLRDADQIAISAALLSAEKAIAAALLAAEKAVLKAEIATDKRFEGVNEFRQALGDLASKQVSRDEYLTGILNLTEKINTLTDSMNRGAGRASGTTAGWAYIIAGAGVSVAVVALLFTIMGR